MNRNPLRIAAILAVFGIASSSVDVAALTIEQAEQISKRTGRPILAVAGSKT